MRLPVCVAVSIGGSFGTSQQCLFVSFLSPDDKPDSTGGGEMDRPGNPYRVLVIGSEPEYLRVMEKALVESPFEFLTASDSNSALSLARKERPDAVVLGYLEPRGASFELHKRLRKGWITKHIPLFVIDFQLPGQQQKMWSAEEAMQMDAEDYLAISPGDPSAAGRLVESIKIIDRISSKLIEKANPLRQAILDPDTFCVTWEQIPGRGAFEIQQEIVFDNVDRAAEGGKIHAISVTDNPGGNPALSTEMLCAAIKKSGMEPLVHLACRDKNRNEIESMLYGVAAEGVRNVLVLSGDYPSSDGFEGTPKPVFDIDPVNTLRLIGLMNTGLAHKVMTKTVTLAPTDFFAGVCVSPFKKLESEIVTQYYKLKKKIQSGAQFIVTQVGYDARKLHEVLQWLKFNRYDIPVLANIYILPYGAAKLMNANGIPGCVVTDKLVGELSAESKSEDKGRSARLLRAAKQYAIAKAFGCAGAHIGGHGITYEMMDFVIDRGEALGNEAESLVNEFSYPQKNGFYFFQKDAGTGLNSDVPAERTARPYVPLIYRISRIAHSLVFNEKSFLFPLLQRFAMRVDSSPTARRKFGTYEHLAKTVMFDCKNCGDCALFDVAYICPMSQCPKEQRNGPCGGSYKGWCEVYPDEKKCIWVQAYRRLKAFHEEEKLEQHVVPPCNWRLHDTSSWLNFYLGRDHTAKRLGIKPPDRRKAIQSDA